MKTVDDYESIRRAYYLEGLSIRAISKRLHHSRRLIRWARQSQVSGKSCQTIIP